MGIGSTAYCQENLKDLWLGNIYTNKEVRKDIFIENRGRKPQKLIWSRVVEPGSISQPASGREEDGTADSKKKKGGKSTPDKEEKKDSEKEVKNKK